MTTQDHAEPMLPTDVQAEPETPYEVGFRSGRSADPYFNRSIPPQHRRAYARGYARGCIERSRTLREDRA